MSDRINPDIYTTPSEIKAKINIGIHSIQNKNKEVSMSNYPPGVSGNEIQIAGPDNEWEEEFECTNEQMEYVMIPPFVHNFCSELGKKKLRIEGQEDLQKNWYHYASMIDAMFNLSDMTTEVQVSSCGYIGNVIKHSYNSEIWWECPKCGKAYEDEYDNYRDYGDY